MNRGSTLAVGSPAGEPADRRKFHGPQKTGALALAVGLYLLRLNRAFGEDHADYRFGSYQEDHGRIGVDTHAWLFEKQVAGWLSLKGEAVYDAISGARPPGRRRPPRSTFRACRPSR